MRRAKEPGVIAPDGLTLPELPANMGWRNPVRGDAFDRDEWQLYRLGSGDSINLATIRRVQPDAYTVSMAGQGGAVAPLSLYLAAAAFAMAAEWARRYAPAP